MGPGEDARGSCFLLLPFVGVGVGTSLHIPSDRQEWAWAGEEERRLGQGAKDSVPTTGTYGCELLVSRASVQGQWLTHPEPKTGEIFRGGLPWTRGSLAWTVGSLSPIGPTRVLSPHLTPAVSDRVSPRKSPGTSLSSLLLSKLHWGTW